MLCCMNTPILFVDTSSLLTLLLGGGEGQTSYAYLRLLAGMAKRGLIQLKTTDMVVGEFLGLQAPVYAGDILPPFPKAPPTISERNVRYGYRLASKRLEFLRHMLQDGFLEIVPTACGEEYLQRLEQLLKAPENAGVLSRQDRSHELDQETIRRRLLTPNTKLARGIHDHNLCEIIEQNGVKRTLALKNGFKDRGEISIADAIAYTKESNPLAQIVVLYEGSDVRARIIQRSVSRPLRHDSYYHTRYHQYAGEMDAKFNPNSEKFNPDYADQYLGNVSFLTTKAFLHTLMLAATHCNAMNGVPPAHSYRDKIRSYSCRNFIVMPDETNSPRHLAEAYHRIMHQVGTMGLGRVYDRYHDSMANIREAQSEEIPDGLFRDEISPWNNYIARVINNPNTFAALHETIQHFSRYRYLQAEHKIEAHFNSLMKEMCTLEPEQASRLIGDIINDLQRYYRWVADQNEVGQRAPSHRP